MGNPFFDIKKSNQTAIDSSPSSFLKNNYLTMHFEKVKNLEDDLGRLPGVGESFALQSDKQFNAFTFVPWVSNYEFIEELFASTYSISMRVVESLVQLHDDGRIGQFTLLISDSMKKRNPTTIDKIMSLEASRPNMTVRFAWNHSKVTLMKTNWPVKDSRNPNYFVLEGSGNWAENAHYEQYMFSNHKGLYDFRKELFTNANFK